MNVYSVQVVNDLKINIITLSSAAKGRRLQHKVGGNRAAGTVVPVFALLLRLGRPSRGNSSAKRQV